MNKKILLAQAFATVGHTMKSDVSPLSLAMMSAIRTAANPNNPGVVVVNDGYVSVVSQDTLSGLTGTVNHLSSIDEIPLIGRESHAHNGEISVITPKEYVGFEGFMQTIADGGGRADENSFDWGKDIPRIMQEQDEFHLAKLKQGKERLSEIVERDRGIEISKQKTELEYGGFIEDNGYLARGLKNPTLAYI